jgi:hypothetical protein
MRVYYMRSRPDHIIDLVLREAYPPRTFHVEKVVNDIHTRDIWANSILPHFLSDQKAGHVWE